MSDESDDASSSGGAGGSPGSDPDPADSDDGAADSNAPGSDGSPDPRDRPDAGDDDSRDGDSHEEDDPTPGGDPAQDTTPGGDPAQDTTPGGDPAQDAPDPGTDDPGEGRAERDGPDDRDDESERPGDEEAPVDTEPSDDEQESVEDGTAEATDRDGENADDRSEEDDSGGLTKIDDENDEDRSEEDDSGGLTKIDDENDEDRSEEDDSGGLTKVDDENDEDDSGGLTKIDDDEGDSGGLTRIDDEDDDDPWAKAAANQGTAGPGADPIDTFGPGMDEEEFDEAEFEPSIEQEDQTPPPGHAVGAPSPGEMIEEDDGEDDGDDGPTGEDTVQATLPAEPDEYDLGEPLSEVDEGPTQPPDDEEMPLAAHIEEMVSRLGVVVVAVAVATAVAFPFAEPVLDAMWYGLLPPGTPRPHLYGPLEKILTEIKVASLAGLLIALPVLVYESYLFMRPGLYPKERRYYLAAVPTSLVLAAIGMAFAYFLVLPFLFEYFILYSKSGVDKLAFGLRVTFDLIVALLGSFALVFQIPLLIMLAIMMGVTSRRWLERRRLYFWGGFLGVGFLMGGADLTGMAPIIIGATMIGLFEGTLALLRWTNSG